MTAMNHNPGGEILVYEAADGSVRVDVRLEQESVWLTQRQMGDLFDTSIDNIGLHLQNIFADEELYEESTTEDFSVVQIEGSRQIRRSLKHYNLDAIISVGYRVNSRRGVRFRQWVARVLREHLVQGYTMNVQRLADKGLAEARAVLDLMAQTLTQQSLLSGEGEAVLGVVQRYGNKRIGTLLFVDYLRRNGLLFRPDDVTRFADIAMVALALLIAESAPANKDLMVRLILNLLADDGSQ
jgi:Virulence protein RhuM family